MTRATEELAAITVTVAGAVRMWAALLVLLAGAAGAAAPGAGRFAAETTVLLGADDARGGELGYRLRAELAVRAQPLAARTDLLLHFTLESPALLLRGAAAGAEFRPRASLWEQRPREEFLALWERGRVTAAYLDPEDPPDVLNYKKALISLFQFQTEEGTRNETDVSGECETQYEVTPLRVRKFKHRCLWEGAWDADEADEEAEAEAEAGARTERRRVVRYELRADGALQAVAADELLLLRGPDGAALRARALTTLTRLAGAAPPAPAPAPLPAALAAHAALRQAALPLRRQDHVPDDQQEESLEAAVEAYAAAMRGEGEGGGEAGADAADAVLRLLPALRRASPERLAALLRREDSADIMEGLARALGLAGAAGAHAAARDAFQLAAADPPRAALGREYLAALALAPRVEPAVLRDALRLAGGDGPLAPAALLAAAAAAARAGPGEPLPAEVKDYALRSLAKCKEESCRATRLLALGQLRRGDVGALLLEHAERGGRAAGLAALAALAAGPRAQLEAARLRLARLALGLAAPAALEVRAAALELAVEAAPHPGWLAALSAALREHGPRELRRVCWQALQGRGRESPELAALLPALDPRPADWCRRAHDGTSAALTRRLGALRLRSVQLAERGVLRRGVVDLALRDLPLLTVEVWARGLEALAAAPPPPRAAREPEDAPEAAAEPEDVAAGLALSVAGTRRPDAILFASQGELLGHVWAGTGSAPTPVLRALVPRAAAAARALQAGVLLHCRAQTALALQQDAQAVVSLWGRTARASLLLLGAGAARLELRARTAWGRLAARAQLRAQPRLQLAASLDFYERPQLCVHAAQPDYAYSRNVTLESVQGERSWRVRRTRVAVRAVPGRTLALGRDNDAACAALAHRDQ